MVEHQWRYSDSSQYDSVCEKCGCTDTSTSAKLPCSAEAPAIRLVRPMQMEYITVGTVLKWWAQDFYRITEKEFVDHCMKESNGSMNPDRVRAIYRQLREEAGI